MPFPDMLVVIIIGGCVVGTILLLNIRVQLAHDGMAQHAKDYADMKMAVATHKNTLHTYNLHLFDPPRPFLYQKVDSKILAAHRNILREIEKAEASYSKIDPVLEPLTGIWGFFNLIHLYNALRMHGKNKRRFNYLRKCLGAIEAEKAAIQDSLNEKAALKQDIRHRIEQARHKIKSRLEELQQKKAALGIKDYERVMSFLALAEKDIQHLEMITALRQKDEDLNFGRADLVLMRVQRLLSIYELDRRTLDVNDFYSLDRTRPQIDSVAAKVEALRNAFQTSSYQQLHISAGQYKPIDTEIEQATRVFDEFMELAKTYEHRKKELEVLSLDTLVVSAKKAEQGWEEFWGTDTESPAEWKAFLQASLVPSKRVELLRAALARMKAAKLINIEQSKIHSIIQSFDGILQDKNSVEETIRRIVSATEDHERIRKKVLGRLETVGSSQQAYKRMIDKRKLASPKIAQRIERIEQHYQSLRIRAQGKKGVNFPSIDGLLDQFERDCAVLVTEHEKEIQDWKKKGLENSLTLARLRASLQEYKPRLGQDTWHYYIELFRESDEEFNNTDGNYTLLTAYDASAWQLIKTIERDKKDLLENIDKLDDDANDILRKIREDSETFADNVRLLKRAWNTPLSRHIREIEGILEEYQIQLRNTEAVKTGPLQTGRQSLEKIKDELYGLSLTVAQKIESATQEENRLNTKRQELDYRLGQLSGQPNRQAKVRKLIDEARQANVPLLAHAKLDEAKREFERPSIQVNGDVTTLIGGDVKITDGDFVVGDNYNRSTFNTGNVTNLYQLLNKTTDISRELSDQDKSRVKEEIKRLSKELDKKELANETLLTQYLKKIGSMAPDILDVALAAILSPAAGFAMVAKKVAERIKASVSPG